MDRFVVSSSPKAVVDMLLSISGSSNSTYFLHAQVDTEVKEWSHTHTREMTKGEGGKGGKIAYLRTLPLDRCPGNNLSIVYYYVDLWETKIYYST